MQLNFSASLVFLATLTALAGASPAPLDTVERSDNVSTSSPSVPALQTRANCNESLRCGSALGFNFSACLAMWENWSHMPANSVVSGSGNKACYDVSGDCCISWNVDGGDRPTWGQVQNALTTLLSRCGRIAWGVNGVVDSAPVGNRCGSYCIGRGC